jgi:HlyD family type I secretion membrane fusion protein
VPFNSNSGTEAAEKNGDFAIIKPGRLEHFPITPSHEEADDDATLVTSFLPKAQISEFLPSVSNWLIFGGISVVIALGAAIPVSAILKYKTTVQAQATVRPAGELRLVQASASGKIQEIRVQQGQKVQKGEVLATIDNSGLITKQNQLQDRIKQQRLQIGESNTQIIAFDSQITAETVRNQAAVTAAQAELAGSSRNYQDKQTKSITEVREIEAKVKSAAETLSASKDKAARYQIAKQAEAISKDRIAEVELAVKQQEQELAAAKASLQRGRAALNPNEAEVVIAERRIAQEQNAGRATLANLDRERTALIQQRIEANKQLKQDLLELHQIKTELQQTMITATVDGTIFQLKLRNNGQTVQAAQEVAKIVPSKTPLEIKAAVLPSDIGKLKEGQSVQMRVSACSYTDYGTIKGTVSRISQDTINAPPTDPINDFSAGASKVPAFYEVTILPASLNIGKGSNQCSVQLGMEGRADIVTREESVLKFLLRKARLLTDI